ncbi:MAG: type II toxin-antitoxin system RelE/ParE family toxin [Alkalinema sp. RU_4_3]|nr:type II toxin-antitoxin system RelE/ParE family toxin [Alkalinema sp. RU_4_3]
MTFSVSWLPSARYDLDRHFYAMNDKNPIAASRVVREILSAGASLAIFPHRGRVVRDSQRRLKVAFGKVGYFLYYRVEGSQVFILQVSHGREDRD